MSGIGFMHKDHEISQKEIDLFARSLSVRGTNSYIKVINRNSIILACEDKNDASNNIKRLDEFNNHIVCYDGRIDNIQNLIKKYEINENLNIPSVIASLFIRFGINSFKEYSGAFSIIICNPKNKEMYAIRDHMGMKPLYFYEDHKKILMSSNIAPIKNQSDINSELDDVRIKEYLNQLHSSSNRTFFKNIKSLKKSSYLKFKENKITIKKYFEFDIYNEISYEKDIEYAEDTRERFKDLLNRQSNQFKKLACKLSGGLDSSSILLNLNHQDCINSYSVIYEDQASLNELSLMKKAIEFKQSKYNHKIITLKQSDFDVIDTLNKSYDIHDQVLPSFNRNFELAIFAEMKRNNDNIIFDGFDGDASISFGLEKFIILTKKLKIFTLINERKKYAEKHNLRFSYKTSLAFFAKHYFKNSYNFYKILNKSKSKKALLKKDFIYGNSAIKYDSFNDHSLHRQILDHASWDYILEFTEQDASLHEIEEIYPFFDKDFMQYLISIPVGQKLNDGRSRYHFRNAMSGLIPNEIQERYTKGVLSSLWVSAIKNLDKKYLINEFFGSSAPLKNVINKEKFIEIIDFNNNINKKDSGRSQEIFSLISLSLWMRKNKFTL